MPEKMHFFSKQLLLLLGITATVLCEQFSDVMELGSLDGVRMTNSYSTSTVNSKIHCGVLCLSDKPCKSVSYNTRTSTCELSLLPGFPAVNHVKNKQWDLVFRADDKIKCDQSWKLWNGHCYYFAQNRKTWIDAQKDCQNRGSNLVKIEDSDENAWIDSMTQDKTDTTWIGANDRLVEGEWRWVSDSSALAYTAWRNGEPNSYDSDEDCGEHFWREWFDTPCTKQIVYICEK